MPAVSRSNDSVMSKDGSGRKCKSPMRTSVGQVNDKNVYANGKLIVVFSCFFLINNWNFIIFNF